MQRYERFYRHDFTFACNNQVGTKMKVYTKELVHYYAFLTFHAQMQSTKNHTNVYFDICNKFKNKYLLKTN